MEFNLKNIPTFGVAGNFTGHLEQAGEARDFVNVKTKEENAPKGIFPTYLPVKSDEIPDYLNVYPFDSSKIVFPNKDEKLQIECECVIACNVKWENYCICEINPIAFAASNDCSIRKEGAKKISEKKNWGASSKGYSDNFISIDKFSQGGILDNYKIACYLIRDNNIFEYGEDSYVKNYSYIYEKLVHWMKEKFNEQKNAGPLEDLHSYLVSSNKPEQIMVSVGATRYTKWGEENFLKNKDKSVVILYPENKYSKDDIYNFVKNQDFSAKDISFLAQDILI